MTKTAKKCGKIRNWLENFKYIGPLRMDEPALQPPSSWPEYQRLLTKDYIIQDRIEESELAQVSSRFDPIPKPIISIVREKVFSDGSVEFIKRIEFSGM